MYLFNKLIILKTYISNIILSILIHQTKDFQMNLKILSEIEHNYIFDPSASTENLCLNKQTAGTRFIAC